MSGSWRTDPTGRHLYRYHDGEGWTDHVADGGAATRDPYDGPPAPTPPAPSPTTPADGGATAGTGGGPWTGSPPAAASGPSGSGDPAGSSGTSWPTGSTPTAGPGGRPPGGDQSWSTAGRGGGGWSTGAKIGAAAGVLGLVLVSGAIGFAMGAATTVVDDFSDMGMFDEDVFADGFEDEFFGDRPLPDEANDSGAVLSSDSTGFEGEIDGATSFDVSVTRRSRVRIEIEEADFDTYLLLYDTQGRVVAEDDDGGAALLSLVDVDLDPGEYQLVVDAFGGDVGFGERITLRVSFDDALG